MTGPAPYPPETLANGWRFEVDLEKVERSDTWLLAKTGAVRGALLLLWSKAWQQTPCGTLPHDDELIALLIDMPAATFAKHRGVLMRGWWLADDGRLYHKTIATRVLAMLDKRANDAHRSAERRARKAAAQRSPPVVTDASRVTPPDATRESDTNSTPSTKHQAPEKEKPPAEVAPRPAAAPPPAPFDGHNGEALNGKAVVAIAPQWELPEAWGVDAEALGWKPREVLQEAEKFRQYWTAGGGAGTRRSVKGWRQSWSTWLGKAAREKR